MPRYDNFGERDTAFQDESDNYFQRFNTRLRPDELKPGELALSVNGRMGVDGAWQPRPGVEAFGSTIANAGALVLPFYIYATVAITSCARNGSTVTVGTTVAHNLNDQSQVYISIDDTTKTVRPDGNWVITVTAANAFTYQIAGAVGVEAYSLNSTGAGSSVGTAHIGLSTNTATSTAGIASDSLACYGSCRWSDPRASNADYIVCLFATSAAAINLATGASTTIAYPSAAPFTSGLNFYAATLPVDMIQAFDKVMVFSRGGTGAAADDTAMYWDGVLTGTPAFVAMRTGVYTQPLLYTAANNTASSGGVVTVTEAAHGLSVGDTVTIFDKGTTALTLNATYQVATVPGAGSFTFFANVDDFAATSVVLGKAQSSGRGFTNMPNPKWGVYHQRRLIVPNEWTIAGSQSSPAITARNIHDELLFSDILDAQTYDLLQNDFRVSGGISDYVQTVHPFTDDNAVAFNRRSLHLISGLSGALDDLSIKEITKEVGLVARKSVVTIGDSVYFLSDNGVYSASFGDLYNLRGAGLPLSDAIQTIVSRINPAFAYRAVGIFHNNRYWLALPLDNSAVNNAVIVYNVLNEGWESLDQIALPEWDISNFIVGSPNGVQQLYAISSLGGINIMDYRTDDQDRFQRFPDIAASVNAIASYAISRQFASGDSGRKKYNSYEIQVESSPYNASNATLSAIAENVDNSVTLNTIAGLYGAQLPASADTSLRGRIGNLRSYGLQVQFTPTVGRPKLRTVKITSSPAFRALTPAS